MECPVPYPSSLAYAELRFNRVARIIYCRSSRFGEANCTRRLLAKASSVVVYFFFSIFYCDWNTLSISLNIDWQGFPVYSHDHAIDGRYKMQCRLRERGMDMHVY